jgi:hypothetical protein
MATSTENYPSASTTLPFQDNIKVYENTAYTLGKYTDNITNNV